MKDTTDQMSYSNPSTATVTKANGTNNRTSNSLVTTTYSSIQNNVLNSVSIVIILIGIGAAILIVFTIIIVITLVLLYIRKSTQPTPKSDYDGQYSTLCRGDTQQLQPQLLQAPTDLYDQIQLSPSTGQTEVISKSEAENTNSLLPHQNDPSLYIDIEQSTVSTSEQPTYAAVKKKQKKSKLMKGKKLGQNQNNAAEKSGEEVSQRSLDEADKTDIKQEDQIKQGDTTPTTSHTAESPEALYTAVKKKPKDNATENEETISSTPPHMVEELYTAVKIKHKGNAMGDKERAPPILLNTVEDLYTAVMKKPKDDPTDSDTEAAPPLPPHTVEELYTAVQKKPKGTAMEDEEVAPPIPPHTMEDYY